MSKRLNRDDVDKLHDYGLHIPTRTVFLEGGYDEEGNELGVGFSMAQRTIKNLRMLDHAADAPITLVINTEGGCTLNGMGIFDAVRACRSPVKGLVIGNAQSMGCVILQACDERVATRYSTIMYHAGTTDGSPGLPFREGKRSAEYDFAHGGRIDQIVYARVKEKKPTLSWQKFKVECDRGIYCSATEALDWGFIDGIEEAN
jgi:ATP-dependent protease ClpP protease subunit